MRSKGKNVSNLRVDNRRLILEYLNEVGVSSRIKIAKELGLTKASLTIMSNQMIDEGIMHEAGEMDTVRVGRKEVRIAINPDFGKVLGISLEKNGVDITLANIRAEVLEHHECKTDDYMDIINKLINENDKIKLVGITFVGSEKQKADDLSLIIKQNLDVPIYIEHNVAALTEAHNYVSQENNFIFIKYGPGIGSAVVIEGELVQNKKSGIGNVNVCGDRLEDIISYASFKQRLSKLTNNSISTSTIADEFSNNVDVRKDISDSMTTVLDAINNAAEFIGTKKVILYGYIFDKEVLYNELIKLNDGKLQIELTPLVNNKISIAAVYHALYKGFMSKGGLI